MIAIWLLGGLLVAVLAAHLARPLVENHWLTAAQFFRVVNPAKTGPIRLRLGNPFRSPALYLRLPMVALLFYASWQAQQTAVTDGDARSIGAWVLVDTSASMSTIQEGVSRAARVQAEIDGLLQEVREAGQRLSVCWRLSAFDLERRDLVLDARAPDQLRQRFGDLSPRPLGTDLGIVRRLVEESPDPQAPCPITHLVVISDLPAPEWLTGRDDLTVIWRDIGRPVPNVGFVSLRPLVNPLTGDVREVGVEVRAFGTPPENAALTITRPDGVSERKAARWEPDGRWYEPLRPTMPGRYALRLDPVDAYRFDDVAAVDVPATGIVRVDWRLTDRSWPERLHWRPDAERPDLRVMPATMLDAPPVDSVPTLIVGTGYLAPPAVPQPVLIADFVDSSMLLEDLNFDIVETLAASEVAGRPALPAGFRPILRQLPDRVWLAQRDRPSAVYIAGLPLDDDDDQGRLSLTVFFNAVRFLLRDRPLPPAYELTTPANPEPDGTRLALHEDEGNTIQSPRDLGSIADLRALRRNNREPRWSFFLAVAAGLFALERVLTMFGGRAWR